MNNIKYFIFDEPLDDTRFDYLPIAGDLSGDSAWAHGAIAGEVGPIENMHAGAIISAFVNELSISGEIVRDVVEFTQSLGLNSNFGLLVVDAISLLGSRIDLNKTNYEKLLNVYVTTFPTPYMRLEGLVSAPYAHQDDAVKFRNNWVIYNQADADANFDGLPASDELSALTVMHEEQSGSQPAGTSAEVEEHRAPYSGGDTATTGDNIFAGYSGADSLFDPNAPGTLIGESESFLPFDQDEGKQEGINPEIGAVDNSASAGNLDEIQLGDGPDTGSSGSNLFELRVSDEVDVTGTGEEEMSTGSATSNHATGVMDTYGIEPSASVLSTGGPSLLEGETKIEEISERVGGMSLTPAKSLLNGSANSEVSNEPSLGAVIEKAMPADGSFVHNEESPLQELEIAKSDASIERMIPVGLQQESQQVLGVLAVIDSVAPASTRDYQPVRHRIGIDTQYQPNTVEVVHVAEEQVTTQRMIAATSEEPNALAGASAEQVIRRVTEYEETSVSAEQVREEIQREFTGLRDQLFGKFDMQNKLLTDLLNAVSSKNNGHEEVMQNVLGVIEQFKTELAVTHPYAETQQLPYNQQVQVDSGPLPRSIPERKQEVGYEHAVPATAAFVHSPYSNAPALKSDPLRFKPIEVQKSEEFSTVPAGRLSGYVNVDDECEGAVYRTSEVNERTYKLMK